MKQFTRHTRSAGFTLIELMIVLVIIGVLAGIAVYNFAGAADKAKKDSTMTRMKMIQGALSTYYAQYSSFPPSGVGMQPLLAEKLLKADAANDMWGRPFAYYSPAPGGAAYMLVSAGSDGIPETEDDLRILPEQ